MPNLSVVFTYFIFSYAFDMFSSRENQGYFEFDVRFHPRVVESKLICHVSRSHYITHIGGRSYSSTTDNLLDFCRKKTELHLQTETYGHLLCRDETSSVAYNSGETQTLQLSLSLLLLFYFSVVVHSGDGAICSKNRKIVPYHGESPNSRISARCL